MNGILYHIRGMALMLSGRIDEAVAVFQDGITRNPRPGENAYFRSALAVAKLRRKDFRGALMALKEVSGSEIELPANVLRFHAYGALGKRSGAEIVYRKIRIQRRSIPSQQSSVAETCNELYNRYLRQRSPTKSDEWLIQQESRLLLAA